MRLARRTLLAGLAMPAMARAAFPDRPIRLVVPLAAAARPISSAASPPMR
ncbi:hypothetical protein ACFQY5_07070 [Paeniroseomonas aquatica]